MSPDSRETVQSYCSSLQVIVFWGESREKSFKYPVDNRTATTWDEVSGSHPRHLVYLVDSARDGS